MGNTFVAYAGDVVLRSGGEPSTGKLYSLLLSPGRVSDFRKLTLSEHAIYHEIILYLQLYTEHKGRMALIEFSSY